jgi:GTP-binding protein Era
MSDKIETKASFVSVIGATNAGKSTLVNMLVGKKISIVSHKVQTTRNQIRGIMNEHNTQIVFIDTPGIFEPKRALDEAMLRAAWNSLEGVEEILLLIDATHGLKKSVMAIIEKLQNRNLKCLVALNKVDEIKDKKELLLLAQNLNDFGIFKEIFMISALSGDGVEDIKKYLLENAPNSPWYFADTKYSDIPLAFEAAEITREKIYEWCHQELPYSIAVDTSEITTNADGSLKINQTILVQREGQQKIVLGKNGEMIKRLGMLAREELERLKGVKIHLFLRVAVKKDWDNDRERLRKIQE